MAATEPGAVRLHPRVVRRNIIASAVNHFFVEGSVTLSEGGTVLPLMVRALGGSTFLAGLPPSLQFMGWLMPQFLAAGRLQRLTRFTSAVQALEAVRASFMLAIAGLALALGRSHPQVVLAYFFPLYLVTRVAAGASAVARSEIVARMVPAEERSTAISARQLGGGIAALLAGLAVRYVLDERVSAFPANYATLLGLSALGFGVAIAALGLVREAELAIKPRVIDAWGQLKRAPALLRREPRYALYLAQRATATGLEAVAPFYIIYATEVLGAPAAAAGVYIAVRTGVRVLSNLFWGRACKRLGSVWVLRTATALAALAPATAVLVALTAEGSAVDGTGTLFVALFGLVFMIHGLAVSGLMIGELAYLYDIAPERDRLSYFGLTSTVLGSLYSMPALGGALLPIVGYVPLFSASAAMLLASLVLALRMAPGKPVH